MTIMKANCDTAFIPMRDPIDRRPLHIGIVLLGRAIQAHGM